MAKKKASTKVGGSATAALVKRTKPKTAKVKRPPLDIEKVRERMKTHKPPQSWYEEDLDDI